MPTPEQERERAEKLAVALAGFCSDELERRHHQAKVVLGDSWREDIARWRRRHSTIGPKP